MIDSFKYSLASWSWIRSHLGNKLTCPRCGRPKCFVPYVNNETNEIIDDEVGRCDHEGSCGYSYPPSDFFKDNDVTGIAKSLSRRFDYRPGKTVAKKPPSYIDDATFMQSLKGYDRNNLVCYLVDLFRPGKINQMIADYYIGTSKHWDGATVFWQIDRFGHVRAGKIMQYYPQGHPQSGHRVKDSGGNGRLNWVHSVLKIPDYNLEQCLFGEHLLSKHPNKIVGIVESEKSAIMASGVISDCIFLACGGCGNLTAKMCEPLRGRNVVLFPDNGKFDDWSIKGKQMRYLFKTIQIAGVMENPGTMERWTLNSGDDIADLIVACNLDVSCFDLELHEL